MIKKIITLILVINLSLCLSFSCFSFNTNANIKSRMINTYPNSYIDIGRSTVFSRASSMSSLHWYVSSQNKTIPSGYSQSITLPTYVQNASVGAQLVGIPYCWGGFNGYENEGTSYTHKAFSNVVTGNYTAGNICCEGGHKPSTIGLDCSGYVSSAYDISEHKNTSNLKNNYGHSISYDRLVYMDFIVKSGDHVVLYYNCMYVNNVFQYNVYDSSVDEGKVKSRILAKTFFTNNSYVCRTPWHTIPANIAGTSNDPHKPTYTNPTSHTWYCSDCGANMSNTHVFNSSGVCILCGGTMGGSW